MCCYTKRIRWIREQVKTLTQEQVEDKTRLRQPHGDWAAWLQWKVLERSCKITALLVMLNNELNKVRPAPKEGSHSVADKWTQSKVATNIVAFTKEVDGIHPYPKLYVVVDKSLSPIQKGIQGSHAIAELFKQHGVLDHSALVFLEASNIVRWRCSLKGIRTATFAEPAWGGKLTATAIEPLEEDQIPEELRELQLAA